MATFVLGVVVGALAALLITPYTGEEVRERLREETDRLLDKVKESVEKIEALRGRIEEEVLDIEEEV